MLLSFIMFFKFFLILLTILGINLHFSTTVAQTMSGGDYTLDGNATSISGGKSDGGDYDITSKSDSIGGLPDGDTYSIVQNVVFALDASNAYGNITNKESGSGSLSISNLIVEHISDGVIRINFDSNIPSLPTLIYLESGKKEVTILTGETKQNTHTFTLINIDETKTTDLIIELRSDNQSITENLYFTAKLSPLKIPEIGGEEILDILDQTAEIQKLIKNYSGKSQPLNIDTSKEKNNNIDDGRQKTKQDVKNRNPKDSLDKKYLLGIPLALILIIFIKNKIV